MATDDAAAKLSTLARLAESRAEIRRVLEPPPRAANRARRGQLREGEEDHDADAHGPSGQEGVFPRSRTMRLLLSGRGIGTVGAIIGGLIMARPALALKLLRMLPTGAVARMLMIKAFTAFRARN